MICKLFRSEVLNSDFDAPLSFEAADHLRGCDRCQSWRERLVAVERDIPKLPIPRSIRKEGFLGKLVAGLHDAELVPDPKLVPAPSATPWGVSPKERGLRKLSLALALSLALVLFAFAWWIWPPPLSNSLPFDTAIALRAHRNALLRSAKNPGQKMTLLAKYADQLQQEAQRILREKNTPQLDVISRCFQEVVCDDLVNYAQSLSPEQRVAVLTPIVDQLFWTESEFQRLLAEQENEIRALREIAEAARLSHSRLSSMLV